MSKTKCCITGVSCALIPNQCAVKPRVSDISGSRVDGITSYRRRDQPQGPLPGLLASASAPDDLRARLAQERLVVRGGGFREDPLHRLRGGEGEHRPPVEAAALTLEREPAGGAVLVLGPLGTPAARPAHGGDRGAFHLRAHGRLHFRRRGASRSGDGHGVGVVVLRQGGGFHRGPLDRSGGPTLHGGRGCLGLFYSQQSKHSEKKSVGAHRCLRSSELTRRDTVEEHGVSRRLFQSKRSLNTLLCACSEV